MGGKQSKSKKQKGFKHVYGSEASAHLDSSSLDLSYVDKFFKDQGYFRIDEQNKTGGTFLLRQASSKLLRYQSISDPSFERKSHRSVIKIKKSNPKTNTRSRSRLPTPRSISRQPSSSCSQSPTERTKITLIAPPTPKSFSRPPTPSESLIEVNPDVSRTISKPHVLQQLSLSKTNNDCALQSPSNNNNDIHEYDVFIASVKPQHRVTLSKLPVAEIRTQNSTAPTSTIPKPHSTAPSINTTVTTASTTTAPSHHRKQNQTSGCFGGRLSDSSSPTSLVAVAEELTTAPSTTSLPYTSKQLQTSNRTTNYPSKATTLNSAPYTSKNIQTSQKTSMTSAPYTNKNMQTSQNTSMTSAPYTNKNMQTSIRPSTPTVKGDHDKSNKTVKTLYHPPTQKAKKQRSTYTSTGGPSKSTVPPRTGLSATTNSAPWSAPTATASKSYTKATYKPLTVPATTSKSYTKTPYNSSNNFRPPSSTRPPTATISYHQPQKKKLVVRGLKNFVNTHRSSGPKLWYREFPHKGKFHPDNYIYEWNEGPKAPPRPCSAMARCKKHGGRCDTCGIFTCDLCQCCRKCELDCCCPKAPACPPMDYSEMFGDGWKKTCRVLCDLTENDKSNPVGGNSSKRRRACCNAVNSCNGLYQSQIDVMNPYNVPLNDCSSTNNCYSGPPMCPSYSMFGSMMPCMQPMMPCMPMPAITVMPPPISCYPPPCDPYYPCPNPYPPCDSFMPIQNYAT